MRTILHDLAHKVLSHLGSKKTLTWLRDRYYWPTTVDNVTAFCRSCRDCAQIKPSMTKKYRLLHTFSPPPFPWHTVSINWMHLPFTPMLKDTRGKLINEVLVFCCMLTGEVELVPASSKDISLNLDHQYMRHVYSLCDISARLVLDGDPQLISQFTKALSLLLGIKGNISTTAHPKSNGAIKCLNCEPLTMLRAWVSDQQDDWPLGLPILQFSINSAFLSLTSVPPFGPTRTYKLLPMPSFGSLLTKDVHREVLAFAERACFNLIKIHDVLIDSRTRSAISANKNRSPDLDWAVGDQVWLSTVNLCLAPSCLQKLLPRFIGPMPIVDAHPSVSMYKLDLPEAMVRKRVNPWFHTDVLRVVSPHDDVFPLRVQQNGTIQFEAEKEFFVDRITAFRRVANQPCKLPPIAVMGEFEFKILWLGERSVAEQWEQASQHCRQHRCVPPAPARGRRFHSR